MLYFENETMIQDNNASPESSQPDFDCKPAAEKVISHILEQEGCPYETQITLILTDEEIIRDTNKTYRSIDRVTDVLSFPNITFDTPGDFSCLEDEKTVADYFDPDSGELILGDIMICLERMNKQAMEYGHSVLREFSFLVAHSVLHLLGYDHIEDSDAAIMESKQNQYLEDLKITRDAK